MCSVCVCVCALHLCMNVCVCSAFMHECVRVCVSFCIFLFYAPDHLNVHLSIMYPSSILLIFTFALHKRTCIKYQKMVECPQVLPTVCSAYYFVQT